MIVFLFEEFDKEMEKCNNTLLAIHRKQFDIGLPYFELNRNFGNAEEVCIVCLRMMCPIEKSERAVFLEEYESACRMADALNKRYGGKL